MPTADIQLESAVIVSADIQPESAVVVGIVVCGWNDNNVVTMISNCNLVEPLEQVKRWNRSQKVE